MTWIELLLTAVALSMDAFAVSTCKGLNLREMSWKRAGIIGLFFGGFQALMPLIGWLLGKQFALLSMIGGKMIYDALKSGGEAECPVEDKLDLKELVGLSFATSIDALAVGISFAFLNVQILPSVATIGVTTCLLSMLGVAIGQKFGAKYQDRATLVGGIVLVLIGVRILLEHLGVFG